MVSTSTDRPTAHEAPADIPAEPQRIDLRCTCGECHLPYAYLEGGMLVIESWHSVNGQKEKHRNVLPLINALSLMAEAR